MTPLQCCEARYGAGLVASVTSFPHNSFGTCCYRGGPTKPWDGTPCNNETSCNRGGCGFTGSYNTSYNCYGPEALPTCTLSASPSSIASGDTATLSWWTTTNAASASIDQGIGSVTPVAAGNRTVTPSITTTYIMTVTGSGTATCQTTISVSQPPCTTGGLVPCGRSCDDLNTTDIDESKPCDLCAAFYMLKNIINFVTELAVGIAIFIIVIAGLLYVFSAGEPGKIESAKSAITYALAGLALVFAAWLVIAIILQGLGPAFNT